MLKLCLLGLIIILGYIVFFMSLSYVAGFLGLQTFMG